MLGDISKIKFGVRKLPVTDDLMNILTHRQDREAQTNLSVMIHKSCRFGRRNSHNVARRSPDGRWYVRKGKRGGIICYLIECEIIIVDGAAILYQFKTDQLLTDRG